VVEEGGPGSNRSGEGGTPFLEASRRAKSRERAGSRVFVSGGRSIADPLPDPRAEHLAHPWSAGGERQRRCSLRRRVVKVGPSGSPSRATADAAPLTTCRLRLLRLSGRLRRGRSHAANLEVTRDLSCSPGVKRTVSSAVGRTISGLPSRNKLPRATEAAVPPEKLTRCALDPSHHRGQRKARVVASAPRHSRGRRH
jgi:hypothetical protein